MRYINKSSNISVDKVFFLNHTTVQCASALLGSIFIHALLFSFINFHGFLNATFTITKPSKNTVMHVQLVPKNLILDVHTHSFSNTHKAMIEPYSQTAKFANTRSEDLSKAAEIPINFLPGISKYFYSNELTEKPYIVQDVAPVLSLGLEGAKAEILLLRLLINERGYVDKVIFESYQGAEDVKELIQAAFQKARFSPGEIHGVAVKSQLVIEVDLEEIIFE